MDLDRHLFASIIFSAFATLNVCGEEITDKNHSRQSLRELVFARANMARVTVQGHTGNPQRQPGFLSLLAVLPSFWRVSDPPLFVSSEEAEQQDTGVGSSVSPLCQCQSQKRAGGGAVWSRGTAGARARKGNANHVLCWQQPECCTINSHFNYCTIFTRLLPHLGN